MSGSSRLILAVVLVALLASLVPAWVLWFAHGQAAEPHAQYCASAAAATYLATGLEPTGSGQEYASTEPPGGTGAAYAAAETTPNTPVGANIVVVLPTAIVTFENVTAEGTTTTISSQDNPLGSTIPDLSAAGLLIDVSTTATYTGSIRVAIRYDEDAIGSESHLRLLHLKGPAWEDVTTGLDAARNLVFGEVESLSWFYLMQQSLGGRNPSPAFPEVLAEALFFADRLSDFWLIDAISCSGNCTLDSHVALETTDFGEELWQTLDYIMFDSIVSWKYWLPAVMDVMKGVTFTYVSSD